MRVFVDAKARFVFRLSSEDIGAAVSLRIEQELEPAEMQATLVQLCEWGNLETLQDATEAQTVEDFFKPRDVFRITAQGEAVEQALQWFELNSDNDSARDTGCAALADVAWLVQSIRNLLDGNELDGAKIRWSLLTLWIAFQDLTLNAGAVIDRLERAVRMRDAGRRDLIEFAERFLAELVLAADGVEDAIRHIEARLNSVPQPSGKSRYRWQEFRNWFIGQPGRPSNAAMLRERARTLIAELLSICAAADDQQIYRIDQSADFRVLARWFAEAKSDSEANRMWRTVFGLCSARHLMINDATLDDYEIQHVAPNTSWLDAPPLRIPVSSRGYLGDSRSTNLTCIIDRTAEKEKLAAAAHDEAVRILNAQERFGRKHRMRLSDLEHLEAGEFDLLLEILGEAVSARVFSAEPVELFSSDGCLRIKLEPTNDGQEALISTSAGVFTGPDQWISIEETSAEEVLT
jgi:uncharacterized protein (TIGR02677 family)